IDALHPQGYATDKPRTYRQKARQAYLRFTKKRKPGKEAIHKATGQQLRFVKRDLGHVEKMVEKFDVEELSNNQKQWLETIRKLFDY
ncbi:MAG: IS5/IS1182 family transposase, partial [Clostridiales bacterium]|nr:IS5/IS1182 family transposase [Clostridiales bacterium]